MDRCTREKNRGTIVVTVLIHRRYVAIVIPATIVRAHGSVGCYVAIIIPLSSSFVIAGQWISGVLSCN